MAPKNPDPELRLAEAGAHHAAGRYPDAVLAYLDVIRSHPNVAELQINLSAAQRAAGDLSAAERSLRRAIEIDPQNGPAWFNLGNLLGVAGLRPESLEALQQAGGLMPMAPEVLNNLGAASYAVGDIEAALDAYRRALAIRPDFADALTNLGNALQRLCRMDEAKAAIKAALAKDPEHPTYLLNMAGFLAANGQPNVALEWTERAIQRQPDYVEARLKRASLLIQLGRLEEGFAAYEDRLRRPGWHRLADVLPMPAWRGEPLDGRRLLVWNEQGFGDAILLGRYLPKLVGMGAAVTFLAEPQLHRLFAQSMAIGLADIAKPPPGADFHVSNMSLPYLLGTTLSTIPDGVPYLRTELAETRRLRRRIEDAAAGKLAVGLAWAGNPGQAHDYSRSIPTGALTPLLDVPNTAFFNLLIGPRGDELRHPALLDFRAEITDFAASATLMAALDLIISVDSAPAHLAGAMARPAWILLSFDPDSRYLLGRADSPWYPTARLWRQAAPGGWGPVIADVALELGQGRFRGDLKKNKC